MTGLLILDWAILAVSLFNTILLLWLGLTVLLNAERRTWGIWLAGGGLLTGGVFFVSHSAILGHNLAAESQGTDFWWHVGWGPVVAMPFAWYALMLWYAGFWDNRASPLHRRQRFWFMLAALLVILLVALIGLTSALPSYWQVVNLGLGVTPSPGGFAALILIFPPYVILCIALSLDALRRPEPSGRMMGDLARYRARPWLVAASAALMLAGLLVGLVLAWIAIQALGPVSRDLTYDFTTAVLSVGWFDLVIASLIGVAIVLLGQAIVSYEVFTGKTLPRRGFFRHWRRAIILAAGYGAVVGGSLAIDLRPIYALLATTMVMVAFYALLVWRSFGERDRAMDNLRPFVASQRLYEHLLTPQAPSDPDADTPFRALCNDVLSARVAFLVPLGPLAPLVAPLAHPSSSGNASLPPLIQVASQLDSPQMMSVPLDPDRYHGATQAVPLWSERGLIGALLLGEKRDGGLYTQEEIEIARASGERLIDTQASAQMARRLMALQRQRLAESQVLDRRARRVLHDDVLPNLHSAVLTLSSEEASPEALALLSTAHRQIADLLREIPVAEAPELARLGLIGALRQMVDVELAQAFDNVAWRIETGAEEKTRTIHPLTLEVLFYATREVIRNAARHGRATDRPLRLCITAGWEDGAWITIEDDGVGLDGDKGTDEDGGQGLALHSTMMAVVGGTLTVESAPGAYTRVTLTLPPETWHDGHQGEH